MIIVFILLLVISAGAYTAVLGGVFENGGADNCIFTSEGKLYLYTASKGEISQLEVPEGSYNASLSGDRRYISVLSGVYKNDEAVNYSITVYDLHERKAITNGIDSPSVNRSDAIMDAVWLGDTVLLKCHLNPDNSLFAIADPFTGKVSDKFSGALLKLIPQRNTYLYRSTYAKFKDEPQHLYLGKKEVYTTEPGISVYDLAINEKGDKVCFFELNEWDCNNAYLVSAVLLEDGFGEITKTPVDYFDVQRGLWFKDEEICLIRGMEYSIFSEEKGSFIDAGRLSNEEDEELTQQKIKLFIERLKNYGIDSQNISYQIWFNK